MSSSILRGLNSTNTPLLGNSYFNGQPEFVGSLLTVLINCFSDKEIRVDCYENATQDSTMEIQLTSIIIPQNTLKQIQLNLSYQYFRLYVANLSSNNMIQLNINTVYTNLLPLPLPVSSPVIISGTVAVSSLPAITNGTYTPTNNGITSSFSIIANAVNNTQVYYQDETQGVNVANGWQFTSVLAGSGTKNTKINWYMYQPTQDVIITDLVNSPTNTYYTIVDNVGIEFPLVYIYTKPSDPLNKITTGTGGSSWYQSKFVYQANQAGTVGTYLLYVGANPTTIRPDLTHINLRQLDILCLGTLQPDEIVLSASLQTSSNLLSPAGNFSLTMQSFGVVIAPFSTTLRTDATGALVINKIEDVVNVAGTVSLSTTTNNNVKINPTAIQAVRTVSLGNIAQLISTGGLCYGSSLINKSPLINCWVKFYIKATAPTAADTPFLIQYLEYVAQYNLNSHNDDWFNMPINTKLWVRATLLSTDSDATDTGIEVEATIFLGA